MKNCRLVYSLLKARKRLKSKFEKPRPPTWPEDGANDEPEWSKMLTELCDKESGLTEWEVKFVDDLATKQKDFVESLGSRFWWPTEKQISKILSIYEERV